MEIAAGLCVAGGALKAYAVCGGEKPGTWERPSADEISVYDGTGAVFATSPTAEAVIRVAKVGVASMVPLTLPQVFEAAAALHSDSEALRVERDDKWLTWTWGEYYKESRRAAKSFMQLGLEAHGCVNIIGFNSPEWFIAQMGAILAGGMAAGKHTCLLPTSLLAVTAGVGCSVSQVSTPQMSRPPAGMSPNTLAQLSFASKIKRSSTSTFFSTALSPRSKP